MSETLAGVTLLALGNGAPDVISSFTAASTPDGLFLSVSSIAGGLLVVTALMSTAIISYSPKPIILSKWILFRDSGFLAIATIFVLYTGIIRRHVDIWTPIGCLAIYTIYVLFVVVQDRWDENWK